MITLELLMTLYLDPFITFLAVGLLMLQEFWYQLDTKTPVL